MGSWVLLDGGRLYTDFVDNKPPLLYAYYALAQLLLGRGLFGVHAFTAMVSVPSHGPRGVGHLQARPARRCRGARLARLRGQLPGPRQHAGRQRRVDPAPPRFLGDSARRRRDPHDPGDPAGSLAGFLLGVATLVKHPAAFWLLALAWASLLYLPLPCAAPSKRFSRHRPRAPASACPWSPPGPLSPSRGGAERPGCTGSSGATSLYAANPITAAGALQRATRYLSLRGCWPRRPSGGHGGAAARGSTRTAVA